MKKKIKKLFDYYIFLKVGKSIFRFFFMNLILRY